MKYFALAFFTILDCFALRSSASVTNATDYLPPSNGMYIFGGPTSYGNGYFSLSSFAVTNFSLSFPSPELGSALTISYSAGSSFNPDQQPAGIHQIQANITERIQLNASESSLTTRVFDTEIADMNIYFARNFFGTLYIVRESPTLSSIGRTSIEDIGDGQFRIDSFFDVFTEVAFTSSGFNTWIPNDGSPTRITLSPIQVPEPMPCMFLITSLAVWFVWKRCSKVSLPSAKRL